MSVSFLAQWKSRTNDWVKAQALGPRATWWMAFLAYIEAIFFILPVDVVLIAYMLMGTGRWKFYATVATVASLAGGITGYLIGLLFFDQIGVHIVSFYHLSDELAAAEALFTENTFLVTFTAAFTPMPYKGFVIAGGFFRIDFFQFVLASLVGRGIRFFFIAYVAHYFGERLSKIIFKYFNIITLVGAIAVTLFLIEFYFDIFGLFTH
jgi:membrane protein YqaA with SNARE-associated domain